MSGENEGSEGNDLPTNAPTQTDRVPDVLGSWNAFLVWCKTYEPLFRFIEVIVVAGAGFWISWQQTKIAEKSLEVSQAELKLVDSQLRLESRQFAPDFRFHYQGLPTPSVGATDKAGRARALDGHAKLFVETRSKDGELSCLANFGQSSY